MYGCLGNDCRHLSVQFLRSQWRLLTVSLLLSAAVVHHHCCGAADSSSVQVFSDRNTNEDNVPVSPLLVVGAVHQHLVAQRIRSRAALILDSGEPREVHHFCTLLAYGADAVCPYLAFEALRAMQKMGKLSPGVEFEEIEVRLLLWLASCRQPC